MRGQGEGGGAVPQVVQPDRRQSQVLADLPEPVGQVLGTDRLPVGVGEHRPAAPPARPGARTGVGVALLGELVPEQFDRLPDGLPAGAILVQGDGAAAGAALGRSAVQLPGQRDELAGDSRGCRRRSGHLKQGRRAPRRWKCRMPASRLPGACKSLQCVVCNFEGYPVSIPGVTVPPYGL